MNRHIALKKLNEYSEKFNRERPKQEPHPFEWFSVIGATYGNMLEQFNKYVVDRDGAKLESVQDSAILTASLCLEFIESLEIIGNMDLEP